MPTPSVREIIAGAVEHERTTHALAKHLAAEARQRGLPSDASSIGEFVANVRAYVEVVPALLDEGIRAAEAAGMLGDLRPLFAAAISYFYEQNDLIPDTLGLAGLVDDAYLSLALLSAASQRHFERTGRHLIAFHTGLIDAHRVIGGLLGPQMAAQLESLVGAKLLEMDPRVAQRIAAAMRPIATEAPPPQFVDPLGGRTPEQYAKEWASAMLPGA